MNRTTYRTSSLMALPICVIVIYGPMMVSYVDIIEDTEGWTMQMWQAKIESYLYLYGELGTEMVALYGKEEVGEVRAAEDTSGWTREQWIAKLNENREKKEEEKEAESGTTTISSADRIKIDAWDYTPSDELYLKYKKVRKMSICVYGRIKRKCINEDLLEEFLVDFFHLKAILSEKTMKNV